MNLYDPFVATWSPMYAFNYSKGKKNIFKKSTNENYTSKTFQSLNDHFYQVSKSQLSSDQKSLFDSFAWLLLKAYDIILFL